MDATHDDPDPDTQEQLRNELESRGPTELRWGHVYF